MLRFGAVLLVALAGKQLVPYVGPCCITALFSLHPSEYPASHVDRPKCKPYRLLFWPWHTCDAFRISHTATNVSTPFSTWRPWSTIHRWNNSSSKPCKLSAISLRWLLTRMRYGPAVQVILQLLRFWKFQCLNAISNLDVMLHKVQSAFVSLPLSATPHDAWAPPYFRTIQPTFAQPFTFATATLPRVSQAS